MMYSTTGRNLRQVFSSEKITSSFCPLDTLSEKASSLSKRERHIVNEVAFFNKKGLSAFFSQETLGRAVGIGRQRTNVLVRNLCSLGMISKTSRYVSTPDGRRNKTSVYQVHPGFFGYLRESLGRYIPNLLGLTLASLISLGYVDKIKAFRPHATQLKKEEKYISYRFGSYTHDLVRDVSNGSQVSTGFYKKKSRRLVMNAIKHFYGENPFGAAIEKVATVMPLTNWGKIKLSPFKDPVILNALKALLDSQVEIKQPVLWLFKKCIEESRRLKIHINWDWMKQLAIAYKMPIEQNLVLVRGNWTFVPTTKIPRKNKYPQNSYQQKHKEPSLGYHQPAEKVIIRDVNPITDYLQFKERMKDDTVRAKHKESERLLGWNVEEMLLKKVCALNLTPEEYEAHGLERSICQSFMSSPENPVPSAREPQEKILSPHLENEKSSGMSMLKANTMDDHHMTASSNWTSLSTSMNRLISMFPPTKADPS